MNNTDGGKRVLVVASLRELAEVIAEGVQRAGVCDATDIHVFEMGDCDHLLAEFSKITPKTGTLIVVVACAACSEELLRTLVSALQRMTELRWRVAGSLILVSDQLQIIAGGSSKVHVRHMRVIHDTFELRKVIGSICRLPIFDDTDRVYVADMVDLSAMDHSTIADETLPVGAAAIMDDITASHVFRSSSDAFRRLHVVYRKENIIECDVGPACLMGPKERYLESVDEFHRRLWQAEGRMTYLLGGHRGCGKSSFIHYYLREYPDFRRAEIPYVVVDFLNYGHISDHTSPNFIIGENLWRFVRQEDKYRGSAHVKRDLYYGDKVDELLQHLKADGVTFNKVFDDSQIDAIYRRLGPEGETGIWDMLEAAGKTDSATSPIAEDTLVSIRALSEAATSFEDLRHLYDNDSWLWLRCVWAYVDLGLRRKPWNFFCDWILSRLCSQRKDIYVSSLLRAPEWRAFCDNLQTRRLMGNPAAAAENDRQLVREFLKEVISRYPHAVVVLDNVDQLDASLAEYRFMSDVFEQVCSAEYERLKFLVTVRPPTSVALQNVLSKVAGAEGEASAHANYAQFSVMKVRFERVVEQRLAQASKQYGGKEPETDAFLNVLGRVLSMAVRAHKRDRSGKRVRTYFNRLTANNIRQALELFQSTVLCPYKRLYGEAGDGLFRVDGEQKYVAENILLRAIFASPAAGGFKIQRSLLNVFDCPARAGYARVLLHTRVMEIVHAFGDISRDDVALLLEDLGYFRSDIEKAIESLSFHKVVLLYLGDVGGHSGWRLSWRFRGDIYLELTGSLSYLQLVYFRMPLGIPYADRMEFPAPPFPGDLEILLDSILHSLACDLEFELLAAHTKGKGSLGIERFERKTNRKLDAIHRDVFMAAKDLQHIKMLQALQPI